MSTQTQHLIQGWVHDKSFVSADDRFPVDCPHMLYEVTLHFQRILAKITETRIGQGWWYLHRITRGHHVPQRSAPGISPDMYSIYDTTATSVNILKNWPEEFHFFLTALELLGWEAEFGDPDDKNVDWLFGRLSDVVFRYPWIDKAYEAYFTQRNARILIPDERPRPRATDYLRTDSQAIPAKGAMKLLDISQPTFDELLQRGILRKWIGPPHLCVSFDGVRTLLTRLRTQVSLPTLEIFFDLSYEEIQGLIAIRVLPLMYQPDPSIRRSRFVSIWSVLICLEVCDAQSSSISSDSPYLQEVVCTSIISPHLQGVMCTIGSNVQLFRERVIEGLIRHDPWWSSRISRSSTTLPKQ